MIGCRCVFCLYGAPQRCERKAPPPTPITAELVVLALSSPEELAGHASDKSARVALNNEGHKAAKAAERKG